MSDMKPAKISEIKSGNICWLHVSLEQRCLISKTTFAIRQTEGKKSLGRPGLRLADNIKMDFVGMEWGDLHWLGLAQDRDKRRPLVNAVMNRRVPQNIKGDLVGTGLNTVNWIGLAQDRCKW
jgi:hypothetical protein